jgi:glutathione S-transferase
MLTLYYTPGACSIAAHIVLEESGEKYDAKKIDLAGGEQRTDAYLKINPLGRVPALRLDNGEPLAENTAILPYLGKRFDLWPKDPIAEAKARSLIGFFAASVHPAHAHVGRPERYASDSAACWRNANGSPTGTPCSIPMGSFSTPGGCASSYQWDSLRTTLHSRTGC